MKYEELDTTVQDWPTDWRELISVEEVSIGPPADAPEEPMCKEQSHHDSDGESST